MARPLFHKWRVLGFGLGVGERFLPTKIAIAATLLLLSCGGGGDGPSGTSTGTNLSGTWDAVYSMPGGSIGAVLQLGQSGSALTGTYVVQGGAPIGRVTGTLAGDRLTFRFDQDAPCPGTFNGTGTVSNAGRRMTGSYTGSDCSGSLSPTFVANKR